MDEWPSWSLFHPRRICMLQFVKRSRSKWRAPLPTWVAPSNSHGEVQDGGAGAEVHADGFQPSKWTNSPRPMPGTKSRLVRSSMRPTLMAGVAEDAYRQTNAASVADSVTGLFSARREEVRAGDEEDVAVEAEEEAVVVEAKPEEIRFSLLLWLSRGQRRLGARCNNPQTLPQCPVAVTRETSCALSWPARTAAGAVGRSGAS